MRDLANFILTLIEHNATGVYNAVGPRNPANFGSLLVASREAAGSDASFVWADEHFLLGEKVKPWVDLPLWLPNSDPNFIGFNSINNTNAVKAGLTFKPLSETVSDTLDWIKTRPPVKKLKIGLSLQKEAALIQKYEEMLKTTLYGTLELFQCTRLGSYWFGLPFPDPDTPHKSHSVA